MKSLKCILCWFRDMLNSTHEDKDKIVENSYLGGRHLILSNVELKPHIHPQRKAVEKTAKF